LAADVLAGVIGAPDCSPRGQVPVSTVRAVVAAAAEDVRRAAVRYARHRRSLVARWCLFRAQRLLLVLLVADTGLRRGELAGLRTDDLLGRELWIERAVKSGGPQGVVVGPTKSHRHGRLTVTVATARFWHDHVRKWHGPKAARGMRSVWLFTASPRVNRPMSPCTLAARFAHVKALAEINQATLHGMRHTVATSLAQAGRLVPAQRRLRHRALGTTLRNYVDTTGLDDEAVADDLERVFLTGHPAG
jgi:integrase